MKVNKRSFNFDKALTKIHTHYVRNIFILDLISGVKWLRTEQFHMGMYGLLLNEIYPYISAKIMVPLETMWLWYLRRIQRRYLKFKWLYIPAIAVLLIYNMIFMIIIFHFFLLRDIIEMLLVIFLKEGEKYFRKSEKYFSEFVKKNEKYVRKFKKTVGTMLITTLVSIIRMAVNRLIFALKMVASKLGAVARFVWMITFKWICRAQFIPLFVFRFIFFFNIKLRTVYFNVGYWLIGNYWKFLKKWDRVVTGQWWASCWVKLRIVWLVKYLIAWWAEVSNTERALKGKSYWNFFVGLCIFISNRIFTVFKLIFNVIKNIGLFF
eukprot:TRINITY_DN43_c0_g6_i1.p5 TRINITY_DN43_c0_g6~~TRINITY_DN43_c0_g6_i1.p5  ORF type:complete len:322 (+),score=-69.79 TRINITY_DN43_c0_g6_i1:3229-4194(+)